jgi:cytochrome b6-f complex iron-sulfur subunit
MAERKEAAAPAGAPPLVPAGDGTDPKQGIWSRRDLLSLGAWGAVLTSWGIGLLAFTRFMFPRVLFEPPSAFKAGTPEEYAVGDISTKWIAEQRTWVGRTEEGFFAIYAQCTHLGCTPRWFKAEDKFKCPCHGSGFKGIQRGTFECGVNFEGPAPRPLERCKITQAEDRQIVVDTGVRFLWEKGEWQKEGSWLPNKNVI